MNLDDIFKIVPDTEAIHVIYLKDGTGVRMSTVTGEVFGAFKLPSAADIEKGMNDVQRQRTTWNPIRG